MNKITFRHYRKYLTALTLNRPKCTFGLSSVTYLGHIIDNNGLHPSPDKVRAIKEAPQPTNTTELKAFLDLIKYFTNSCLICQVFLLPYTGY